MYPKVSPLRGHEAGMQTFTEEFYATVVWYFGAYGSKRRSTQYELAPAAFLLVRPRDEFADIGPCTLHSTRVYLLENTC